MGAALYGLMFALLYRNLMAVCQIWCERRDLAGSCLESGDSIGDGSTKASKAQCWHASCLFSGEFELVRGIER
jgi:hypothetical protein